MIQQMPEFKTLLFEEREPHIGIVTMNRPEHLNAINLAMLDDFENLFHALTRDDAIRVLIITGSGRGYSSGADLNDAVVFRESDAFADPEHFMRIVQERYASLILGMRRIPQPVISAVNGPAAGGGFSMTLASDIRVASSEAFFVGSFINIGLSGGELGCSYFLPRLVGLSRASDMLFTGRRVMAGEALEMGLVNDVVPREELLEKALSYARVMTGKSVGGLKLTKRVLEENLNAPSLECAVNLENRNQTIMLFSGDFFKLIQSFHKG
jgi:enoyl-CoA hydratase